MFQLNFFMFACPNNHCSERAIADTMLMKELEGILADARHLESYLKEKKQHLRQTLDLISEKLQN